MYLKEIPCINKVTIPYHTSTVVQGREGGGGGDEPLPGVFDIFQYFEAILRLVESL